MKVQESIRGFTAKISTVCCLESCTNWAFVSLNLFFNTCFPWSLNYWHSVLDIVSTGGWSGHNSWSDFWGSGPYTWVGDHLGGGTWIGWHMFKLEAITFMFLQLFSFAHFEILKQRSKPRGSIWFSCINQSNDLELKDPIERRHVSTELMLISRVASVVILAMRMATVLCQWLWNFRASWKPLLLQTTTLFLAQNVLKFKISLKCAIQQGFHLLPGLIIHEWPVHGREVTRQWQHGAAPKQLHRESMLGT